MYMRKIWASLVILLVFVPASALPIYAQVTIDGRVLVDEGTEPLAGVRLELQQTSGETHRRDKQASMTGASHSLQ